MVYCTTDDIRIYTGFTASDFRRDGEVMTTADWESFLRLVISRITQIINDYCNVLSFETHAVTEYHNGTGATGDEKEYLPNDKEYVFREQPVLSVTSVYEDVASLTDVPDWTERTERTDLVSGDYILIERNELTTLRFVQNVPMSGYNNLRLIYNSGYSADSTQFNAIKTVALDMCSIYLLKKKKVQETTTVRSVGVRDYSQMFELFGSGELLTDDVKSVLNRYRKPRIDFTMYQ